MGLDGVLADDQPVGDLGVGQPRASRREHLEFAGREASAARSTAAGRGPVGRSARSAAGDRRREQRVAGGDHADRGQQAGSRDASLSRKPLAPARSAAYTYSSRSKVVSMSDARPGPRRATVRRVASMPSSPGIRMSISTTSGLRGSRASSTASSPSAASPDDLDVVSALEDHPEPGPDQRLVVDEEDLDHRGAPTGSRARTAYPPSGHRPAST